VNGITKYDAGEQIKRLTDAGYSIPKDTDRPRLAEAWCSVLSGVDVDDVRAAVAGYIREGGRYFPKPGEILGRARKDGDRAAPSEIDASPRGRYMAWEQHSGDGSPCPVCGAVIQKLRPKQRHAPEGGPDRWGVYHDRGEHLRQGIPHVGYPHPAPEKVGTP
jgi:hypothetical protein